MFKGNGLMNKFNNLKIIKKNYKMKKKKNVKFNKKNLNS